MSQHRIYQMKFLSVCQQAGSGPANGDQKLQCESDITVQTQCLTARNNQIGR